MKRTFLCFLLCLPLTAWAQAPALQTKAYEELPLGAIKPRGWLLETLSRQCEHLTSRMDELYPQVMDARNGWLGGDGDQWERGPYWIDGALPLAYQLGHKALQDKVQKWVEWTLASQREDGFFGPATDYPNEPGIQRNNAQDWWPRMVMLKVLKQHYMATGDARVLPFLTRYFHYQLETLPQKPLGHWTFWARFRACDNMDVVLWLYRLTQDPKLLDLGRILHQQSFDYTGAFLDGELLSRQYSIHCVNLAQGFKEPLIYWQQEPDPRYLQAVKKGFADLRHFNGFANGMYGGDEGLHGNNPTQGSELCSAVELMYSLELMAQISGDLAFVDHLERIAYNALPSQITDDFMGRQYFQLPNQVCVVSGNRNFDTKHEGTGNLFGLLAGYPCCTANMHQGWPKFVQNLWYATPDGGLAALAYGPSEVEAVVKGVGVKVVETTAYPMDATLDFVITPARKKGLAFPLHLRIPSWTTDQVAVTVNGEPVQAGAPGTVLVIDRLWLPGDVVRMELPMPLKTQSWYQQSLSVERGPLVYALCMEERWEEKRFEKGRWGTAYWEVTSSSPWNFALELDPASPDQSLSVEIDAAKLHNTWFWNPESVPLRIKAKGRAVDSWKLYDHQMTGPLPYGPALEAARQAPLQDLILIPYGATTLRISQFPVLGPRP